MIWVIVFIAGLLEVVWAMGLKYSDGFSRLWPSVITIIAMVLSFILLSQAMRSLPAGTVYAVWVGIGAVGTAIAGKLLLGEVLNSGSLFSMSLIIMGIIGLKLAA